MKAIVRVKSVFLFVVFCSLQTNTLLAQRAGTMKNDATTQAAVVKPADRSALSLDVHKTSGQWFTHDIAQVVPQVAPGVACPLTDVLSQAGKRAQELVGNVDKFTATEIVEHQGVDPSGRLRRPEIRKFKYLVSIAQMPNGYLNVEEYRNGGSNPDQFPDQIATVGTPTLVLIFHPQYAKNFRMTCEGLGQWHEQPAWQVRFEESTDRHSPISDLVMGGRADHRGDKKYANRCDLEN